MPTRFKNGARVRNDKLGEALELLNEAAQEKKDELYHLIEEKYSHIKDMLAELAASGKEAVVQAKETSQKKIKETVEEVDEKLHENPWPFLGGIAAVCLFLGAILSPKKRKAREEED